MGFGRDFYLQIFLDPSHIPFTWQVQWMGTTCRGRHGIFARSRSLVIRSLLCPPNMGCTLFSNRRRMDANRAWSNRRFLFSHRSETNSTIDHQERNNYTQFVPLTPPIFIHSDQLVFQRLVEVCSLTGGAHLQRVRCIPWSIDLKLVAF